MIDSLDFSEVCTTSSDGEVVTRTFIGSGECRWCGKDDAEWVFVSQRGRRKRAEGCFCSIRCREMHVKYGPPTKTAPPPPLPFEKT